jgi:hypothetical protein
MNLSHEVLNLPDKRDVSGNGPSQKTNSEASPRIFKGLKYTAFSNAEYREKKGGTLRTRETRSIEDFGIEEVNRYLREQILPRNRRKEIWIQMKLNDHWKSICGSLLYPHLRVVGMSGSQLVLEADAGIWVEQARMFEGTLKDRILDYIPGLMISALFFRVGNFKPIAQKFDPRSKQQTLERQMQRMLEEARRRETDKDEAKE